MKRQTKALLIKAAWAYPAIIVAAISPILISVAAGRIALLYGVELHEGYPPKIPGFAGPVISQVLYTLGVCGWLFILTIPAGVVALVVLTVNLIVGIFRAMLSPSDANASRPCDDGPERYRGRPLLIVLEAYVLDCIGELQPDKQSLARSTVQRVWGGNDDWKATLRRQLRFSSVMDETLREMWLRNQELSQQRNEPLSPNRFARFVADSNFASMIEDPDRGPRSSRSND